MSTNESRVQLEIFRKHPLVPPAMAEGTEVAGGGWSCTVCGVDITFVLLKIPLMIIHI
jgi:hypothetical protein